MLLFVFFPMTQFSYGFTSYKAKSAPYIPGVKGNIYKREKREIIKNKTNKKNSNKPSLCD